jgi:hypothetical protein
VRERTAKLVRELVLDGATPFAPLVKTKGGKLPQPHLEDGCFLNARTASTRCFICRSASAALVR